MTAARVVEPEWLDALAPEDPRAMRSRRDLARINALMGNTRIVSRELARSGSLHAVAEIGAGDGTFLLKVLPPVDRGTGRAYLIDRQPVADVSACDANGWRGQRITADVFDWLAATAPVDAIVANLFLHHFDTASLSRMLALIAERTRVFIACEPRRSSTALVGSRLLGAIGCNDVTRHDAVVSVRAGFSGREITSLWPQGNWTCDEGGRGLFSHTFVARAT